jgi:hypothetical protein
MNMGLFLLASITVMDVVGAIVLLLVLFDIPRGPRDD